MKFITTLILLLLLSGCMGGYVKVKDKAEQETCYVFYMSFLRSVDAGKINVCGVEGSSEKATVETQVLSDALKAYNPARPYSLLRSIQ